jgi:hypothetical protein
MNSSSKIWFTALVCLQLLFAGCASSDSGSAGPDDAGMQHFLKLKAFKGVPVESVRGAAIQTAGRAVLITDNEIIFSALTGDGWHTPQMRIPLNQIASMRIVSDAYGFTTSFVSFMGLNPLKTGKEQGRSPAYAGIEMTFNGPVVDNFYSKTDRVIAFDVHNFGMVNEGRVTELTQGGRADSAAAEKLMQFITSMKSQSVGAASTPAADYEAKLQQLKSLLERGLIDKATYDKRAAEILRGQ